RRSKDLSIPLPFLRPFNQTGSCQRNGPHGLCGAFRRRGQKDCVRCRKNETTPEGVTGAVTLMRACCVGGGLQTQAQPHSTSKDPIAPLSSSTNGPAVCRIVQCGNLYLR